MVIKTRIHNVQKHFNTWKCDSILIENPIDLFYLTGLQLSAGKLFINTDDAFLIVDGRYYDQCKKNKAFVIILAKTNENSFQNLLLEQGNHIQNMAFDSSNTSYKAYEHLSEMAQTISKKRKKKLNLVTLDHPIKKLRAIKDKDEIKLLRAAADLGNQGLDYISSLIHPGIKEMELAKELEIFWLEHGGSGLAFEPIIAFGANASMPHYRAGKAKLKNNQSILIDIGVKRDHYHSDMTRMIYFGYPDPKFLEIHAIVQEAQQTALALCKPGTLIGDLDHAARDVIAKYGYSENFTHSLGHGVGLEIHEYPFIRDTAANKEVKLEKGMVITIEPGIYLSEFGGVRLEDTVVITHNGYENLTSSEG